MRKPLVLLGICLVLASLLFSPLMAGLLYGAPASEVPVLSPRLEEALAAGVENLRVIVWFRHHTTLEERMTELALRILGLENRGATTVASGPRLMFSVCQVSRENVRRLLEVPDVKFVDLDFPVSVPESPPTGAWFLTVDEIAELVDVSALPGDGRGVDVFVLDTGAPPGVELASAVTFVGGDPYDHFGHGSAVIGIIRRLAPGARIHSVKVLGDRGDGSASDILRGLEWVVRQPGEKKIVNASLGAQDSFICSLKEGFTSATVEWGVDAVAAAGNEPDKPLSPSTAVLVCGVGAVGADNRLTEYSARDFDVVSYGNQVCALGPLEGREIRGTSFASPVVTALAARYMSSIKGGTKQVNLAETLKRGSVRTPEGHRLVTASALEGTPPVPEAAALPTVLFWPLFLSGAALVIAGALSR